MNNLISVRTNIIYSKSESGEMKRHQELIFLVDQPEYRRSTEGEIVRERGIKELRFTVTEDGYKRMMEFLTKLQTVQETDLE